MKEVEEDVDVVELLTMAMIQTANTTACHTHGLTRNANHTSENCRTPGPNHQRNATFRNRMNGSDYLCHIFNTPTNTDQTATSAKSHNSE